MTSQAWTLLVAVLAIALLALRFLQKRHTQLKQRFGHEYDLAVAHYGSIAKASQVLHARQKRVAKQKLRSLQESDRAQFSSQWRDAQMRFVDDPFGAVQAADALIDKLMRARGYSAAHAEQRIEDLTVDHAGVVQHYRAARALAEANHSIVQSDTEELRQAFVHFRALFADLLEQPDPPKPQLQPERQIQEANA